MWSSEIPWFNMLNYQLVSEVQKYIKITQKLIFSLHFLINGMKMVSLLWKKNAIQNNNYIT